MAFDHTVIAAIMDATKQTMKQAEPQQLIEFPDTRQSTDYSCGAAALQAVLYYYGTDKREDQLRKELGTTDKDGTEPNAIVRVARKHGLTAELKKNGTVDDLKKYVDKSVPVIVAFQAWGDKKDYAKDENGHYGVVIGYDDRFIYIEDPSLLNYGKIAIKDFEKRWHDTDKNGKPYEGLMIVMGGKPIAYRKLDIKKIAEATVQVINKEAAYTNQLTIDKLERNYPHLANDPVHRWRAENNLELLHREPDIKELERIILNWHAMSDAQKAISDKKSIELFGKPNTERINELRALYSKKAVYAPGIPDKTDYGAPTTELTPNELAEFVLQHHSTARRPNSPHYDLRIGQPGKTKGLYSWAVPKAELPEPGQKKLVVQTQVHSHPYGDFTGVIGKGYGEGHVQMAQRGKALITKVTPSTVNFTIADSKSPTRYSLVQLQTGRKTKDWLLLNRRLPSAPEGVGEKPKMQVISADDLDGAIQKAVDVQAKIDGTSMVYEVSPKGIEAFSVRKSVKGEPIIHTERLGLAGKMAPGLEGTILRGEAYGMQKGKAIPFNQVAGILNSTIAKSIADQRARQIQMQNALFDVIRYRGKPAPRSYTEKKFLLKDIAEKLQTAGFTLPESATGPAASKLVKDIVTGKNPTTSEGVILRMPDEKVLKYKVRPDSTVYFSGVYPGQGKRKDIGGITYSLKPGGEVVGNIGTGFTEEDLADILKNRETYMNRPLRVGHQGQFGSGAFRAPAFQGWETDKAAAEKLYQVPSTKVILPQGGTFTNALASILGPKPGKLEQMALGRLTDYWKGISPPDRAAADAAAAAFIKQHTGKRVNVDFLIDKLVRSIPDRALPPESFDALQELGVFKDPVRKALDIYKKWKPTTQLVKNNAAKAGEMTKKIEGSAVPLAFVGPEGKEKAVCDIEIADTPEKQRKGLSKRSSLADNCGMLFTKCGGFWMKDCLIPLDIAFLSKSGTILDKQSMSLSDAPDVFKPVYISRDPTAVYALEMPAGWFDKHNVNTGDRLCVK